MCVFVAIFRNLLEEVKKDKVSSLLSSNTLSIKELDLTYVAKTKIKTLYYLKIFNVNFWFDFSTLRVGYSKDLFEKSYCWEFDHDRNLNNRNVNEVLVFRFLIEIWCFSRSRGSNHVTKKQSYRSLMTGLIGFLNTLLFDQNWISCSFLWILTVGYFINF